MKCKANGCPLSVDFITHWHDDGSARFGVCRFHRLVEGDQWTATTQRIVGYETLLRVIKYLQNLREPLAMPLPGEKFHDWIRRVDDNLLRILTGQGAGRDADRDFGECYRFLYGGSKNGKDSKK